MGNGEATNNGADHSTRTGGDADRPAQEPTDAGLSLPTDD